MNKLIPLIGLMGIVVAANAAEVKWEKNYASALAKAKAEKRLLMVDFYTDW